MKVEIIHTRHPDEGCSHRVYVNGVEITGVDVEDIDPRRGHLRSDWDQRVHDAYNDTIIPLGGSSGRTAAFRGAVYDELFLAGDSKFIEEDDDEPVTYHVEDNNSGAHLSREFESYARAAGACYALNSVPHSGGYAGVYDNAGKRILIDPTEEDQ